MIGNLALPSLTLACRCSVEALHVKHSGGCLSPAFFSASRHVDYRFVCLVGLAFFFRSQMSQSLHWYVIGGKSRLQPPALLLEFSLVSLLRWGTCHDTMNLCADSCLAWGYCLAVAPACAGQVAVEVAGCVAGLCTSAARHVPSRWPAV